MRKTKHKILLIIGIIILLVIVGFGINEVIIKHKNKVFINNITNIMNEEEINVIVEINPSISLTVKNGTVIESKCLNNDCLELLNKMNYNYNDNLNNQKLDKVLNEFYNGAKENGYDTSNGITVSSNSSHVEAYIKDVKESTFVHITLEEENTKLDKEKADILSKDEYNQKLLNELKNDEDYGEVYTCDVYDGEVKCYITNFMSEIMKSFGKSDAIDLVRLELNVFKLKRVLNKFDFKYETENLAIKNIQLSNGKTYNYTDKVVTIINDFNNTEIDRIEIINCLTYSINKYGPADEYGSKLVIEEKNFYIPFAKVDLLTKTYRTDDVIWVDYTTDLPDRKSVV